MFQAEAGVTFCDCTQTWMAITATADVNVLYEINLFNTMTYTSKLCVQSSLVPVVLGEIHALSCIYDIIYSCYERLECSLVYELVTSLSDVASTDIESSDTATESAD